jgi:serine/threonine protein phosphatase PrpC
MAMISDGILETLPLSNLQQKLDLLLSKIQNTATSVESLSQALQLDQTNTLPDDITILLIKRAV